MRVTRRGLLIGAGAGGGLLLGWALTPRSFAPPLAPGKDEVAFNAWLKIGSDGVVSVAVPQLEMGQGVTTLIPQIVAVELGADWRQVAVEPAPVSGAYPNVPLAARWAEYWMPALSSVAAAPDSLLARRFAESGAFMATADGLSLAAYELPARIAAASARAMLCMAAAERWNLAWEECEAANGFVSNGKQRLSFAELASEAADHEPPDPPALRPAPASERVATVPPGGRLAFPRLDLPAKVDGSLQFAGDVRLPDMLFAAIRHAPYGKASLGEYDAGKAKGLPGFVRLVAGSDWLAAVATDWWAAERALKEVAPHFSVSHRADSTLIARRMEEALMYGDATTIYAAGEVPSRWSVALRYDVAPALHATLETASVTARFDGARLELWVASQDPAEARRCGARALGIDAGDVVLYPMPAGGSFDRRLEHEHVTEAALIARETGKPVQLVWSRWQEHVAGLPRAPVSAVMAAQTTANGDLASWKARLALPAATSEFGRRLFGAQSAQQALAASSGESDAAALDGAIPPYAVPNQVIEQVPVETLLPAGRMRGQAHGYTAFFTECFIDELAHRAGREPFSFRMALLGQDPRLAQCLQRAASLAGWNGGKDGSGQGLACHRMSANGQWGWVAAVATARRDQQGVRVDKLHCVADIGRIVNADIARQQLEGGLVFGLGLALGAATAFAEGLPLSARLGQLGLPMLATCPEIEVDFVEGEGEPFDPGELGVAVVAPAVANALFSATGLRFRKLPLVEEVE
jgi:isoquinoline 1-oxidoreductase beta subunit